MNIETIGVLISAFGILMFIVSLIILIIQAIRRKKKKPALIMALISVILVIGGFGVFISRDPDLFPKRREEAAKIKAEVLIFERYMTDIREDNMKNLSVHFVTENVEDKTYTYYGKYTIIDNYGDEYIGDFKICLIYTNKNEDGSPSFYEETVDIGTAYKKD